MGSEAGTNGQGHEYGVARPESTSSGSSLSLTQRGWAPMVEPRLETKSVEDPERLKENKQLFLWAPAGLNECGPLFRSSSSHGSEEELEMADLSAFLQSDSGKLEN